MNALLRFLFSAIGLLVASSLVPGLGHGSFLDLLIVAVLLGALNATVGVFLKVLAFVPMACSLGSPSCLPSINVQRSTTRASGALFSTPNRGR